MSGPGSHPDPAVLGSDPSSLREIRFAVSRRARHRSPEPQSGVLERRLEPAYLLARRDFPGKSLFDAIVHLPLVLPPVVVGYALLLLLGRRGPLGALLEEWFGIVVAFRWTGAAIACAVMGFPLMVRAMRLSIEAIDPKLDAAAQTLGAGRMGVFLTVTLPLAVPGIVTGTLLSFARSLGEFGATIMVMGDLPGRQTLPISIYNDYVSGDLARAWPGVVALTAISLGVIFFYNRSVLARRD